MKPQIPNSETALKFYRNSVRLQGINSRTHCDGCGLPTRFYEMHEIFARAHTRGDYALRWWSYHPEVAAFLCRGCHEEADNKAEMFLAQNIRRYGVERVAGVIQEMLTLRPTLLYQIQLPEVLYDYIQRGT